MVALVVERRLVLHLVVVLYRVVVLRRVVVLHRVVVLRRVVVLHRVVVLRRVVVLHRVVDVVRAGVLHLAVDVVLLRHSALLPDQRRTNPTQGPSVSYDVLHSTRRGIFQTSLTRPTVFHSCLLYTSPSPRDLSTSRMPSSA